MVIRAGKLDKVQKGTFAPEQVQKRVTQSDKNINMVINFVDPIADDSA